MRRLVVATFVVLMSLSLVACGGGGEEPEPAETPPPAAAPAPVPDDDAAIIEDKSPTLGEMFEPFPEGEFVSEAIADRLESKQPMLLYFYDGRQKTTNDVTSEVKAAVERNRGAIDLISYDVTKYRSDESTSLAAVDPAIQEDEAGKQAIELARQMGVDFTPFVVIVDQQGYIIFKWRGPIDRDLLDRQVQRVG